MRFIDIRNLFLLCLIFVLNIASVVGASWPPPPQEHTVYSDNKQFAIKFLPPQGGGSPNHGAGIAYRCDDSASLAEEIYRVDFHTARAELSNDGTVLVRIGAWASRYEELSDLAISFYRSGKLMKEYSVKDLARDPTKFQRYTGNYRWLDESSSASPGFSSSDQTEYQISLVDGTLYSFGMNDGSIKLETKTHEFTSAERESRDAQSQVWLEDALISNDFSTLFRLENSFACDSVYGVSFPGKHIIAYLRPIDTALERSTVEHVFQWNEATDIQINASPSSINDALHRASKTPLMLIAFEKDLDTTLVLRSAGDDLFWNQQQVNRLQKLLDTNPEMPWCQLSIQWRGKHLECYHPVDTDLIVFPRANAVPSEWFEFLKLPEGKELVGDSPCMVDGGLEVTTLSKTE